MKLKHLPDFYLELEKPLGMGIYFSHNFIFSKFIFSKFYFINLI